MNKHYLQQDIQRQQVRDTKRSDQWLKTHGLSPDSFIDIDAVLLQAQQIAHNCLKHHGSLLDHREAQVLNNFLQRLQKKVTRKRIQPAQAFKVMNIGTSLNRRVFKQFKQLQEK